jgi:uncharacterized membrane protein
MLSAINTIFTILFVMLALDSVYLYLTKSIFGQLVAKIQRTALELKWAGAVIVYALLAIGLYIFILEPGKPLWQAALLGLVIYGVFDFTNYAMFKKYDLEVALMDMVWGSILLTATTYIVRLIITK